MTTSNDNKINFAREHKGKLVWIATEINGRWRKEQVKLTVRKDLYCDDLVFMFFSQIMDKRDRVLCFKEIENVRVFKVEDWGGYTLSTIKFKEII